MPSLLLLKVSAARSMTVRLFECYQGIRAKRYKARHAR